MLHRGQSSGGGCSGTPGAPLLVVLLVVTVLSGSASSRFRVVLPQASSPPVNRPHTNMLANHRILHGSVARAGAHHGSPGSASSRASHSMAAICHWAARSGAAG